MRNSSIAQNRKSVTFRLIGGLGNQLFVLAAGKYYSNQRNIRLQLDCSFLNKDLSKHWVSIQDFQISDEFIYKRKFIESNYYLDRIRNFLLARSKAVRRLQRLAKDRYTSKKIGFDSELEFTSATYIMGYFQTWRYAEKIKDKLYLELELITTSSWYLEMKELATLEYPIVLHVRRGDFKNEINSYMGLLGEDYYRRAVQHLRSKGNNRSIWVFSDEMVAAKKLLKFLDSERVTWVSAPKGISTPEEELMLMRFGSAHIVANSTFSWWAAYLSKSSKCIVAPTKWFKDIEDPEYLIPSTWTRIESSWEAQTRD